MNMNEDYVKAYNKGKEDYLNGVSLYARRYEDNGDMACWYGGYFGRQFDESILDEFENYTPKPTVHTWDYSYTFPAYVACFFVMAYIFARILLAY
jgi:hypothetical protein